MISMSGKNVHAKLQTTVNESDILNVNINLRLFGILSSRSFVAFLALSTHLANFRSNEWHILHRNLKLCKCDKCHTSKGIVKVHYTVKIIVNIQYQSRPCLAKYLVAHSHWHRRLWVQVPCTRFYSLYIVPL